MIYLFTTLFFLLLTKFFNSLILKTFVDCQSHLKEISQAESQSVPIIYDMGWLFEDFRPKR